MRKFKTAAKNRTNYVYYTAEGKPIVITPGMVGEDGKAVTESLITIRLVGQAIRDDKYLRYNALYDLLPFRLGA